MQPLDLKYLVHKNMLFKESQINVKNNLLFAHKMYSTVKPAKNGHFQKDQKLVFKTNYRFNNAGQKYCRMLQGEHSVILSTFIKLPFVIKIFVLSIFEWPLETGFTVQSIKKIILIFRKLFNSDCKD